MLTKTLNNSPIALSLMGNLSNNNAIRLLCFASIETRIGIEIAEKRARNGRGIL